MQLFSWMTVNFSVTNCKTVCFLHLLHHIIHTHHLYTFHSHACSFTYYNYCKHVTKKKKKKGVFVLQPLYCTHCPNSGGVIHNLNKVLFRRIKDRPITNPVILYIHRSLLLWHKERIQTVQQWRKTHKILSPLCHKQSNLPVPQK